MSSSSSTSRYRPSLFVIGEGVIDPFIRVQRGEINDRTIDQLAIALEGSEYFEEIHKKTSPTKCVDGRSRSDEKEILGFNAAGGSFSLVMADALTHQSYRQEHETAPQHANRMFVQLLQKGFDIGGHDDDNARPPSCGCGAEDRLDSYDNDEPALSILNYISRRGDVIRNFLESLGIVVSNELHELIMKRCHQLHSERYATSGQQLRQVVVDLVGKAGIETLTGMHREVALVVNSKASTTLNRTKIKRDFGDSYQVFNVDAASLHGTLESLSLTRDEAQEKFVGALYYNVATAAVLAGPSLRLITR